MNTKPATDKPKNLYTFNWKGEGYNQVYATSKAEALIAIDNEFRNKVTGEVDPRFNSKNICNLKECSTPEQIKAYWDNFPLMD